MNISNRGRNQPSFSTQYSFYFISLLILILFTFTESVTSSSLYSQFNNELDRLSNLAEKKVKAEAQPLLDEIYQKSGKLLENPFVDVLDEEDTDKLQKMTQIEKLIDALEPYSNEPKENPSRKRYLRHQHSKKARNIKDAIGVERKSRNIFDGGLGVRNYIVPESNAYVPRDNKWPSIAESGGLSFASEEQSILPSSSLKSVFRRSRCPAQKIKRKSRMSKQIQKRFNAGIPLLDPRPVMNSAASLYPGVIAKVPELTPVNMVPKLTTSGSSSPVNFDVNALAAAAASLSNTAAANSAAFPSMDQIKGIQQILQRSAPRQVDECPSDQTDFSTSTTSNNCDQITISANVSNMLEKVLNDLEAIKGSKMSNVSADGTPCKVAGFWNSEIAGVRFDLTVQSNASNCPSELGVQINKRRWKRKDPIMDTSWSCSGTTLRQAGGPFYLAARKKGESGMATFSGFCMTCGGCDIVFGAWTIVNPCRNCTEVSLSIDTKRDIFRRDMEEERKAREKEEKERAKFSKIGCLKDKSEAHEQNQEEEGFSADTFYEYF